MSNPASRRRLTINPWSSLAHAVRCFDPDCAECLIIENALDQRPARVPSVGEVYVGPGRGSRKIISVRKHDVDGHRLTWEYPSGKRRYCSLDEWLEWAEHAELKPDRTPLPTVADDEDDEETIPFREPRITFVETHGEDR